MIKRHLILPLFLSLLTLCASAQTAVSVPKHTSLIKSLDLELTAGTNGIGLDLALPVNDFLRVRAGGNFLPHLTVPLTFNLMSYTGDGDMSSEASNNRFDRMSKLMYDFTGMKIDKQVDMKAHGNIADFKLLVDFYPLRNKHWYATAGFYIGTSKVGHVENSITEAPSLAGVMMYNRLYDFFVNGEFYYKVLYGDNGLLDPVIGMQLQEKFLSFGRVGAHVGDFMPSSPMGDPDKTVPYMLTPDENGTIRADMYVNTFKPYVGVGYDAAISKDRRWSIGFDAGIMIWGKPKLLTHERYIYNVETETLSYGTILGEDLENNASLTYSDRYGHIDLAKDVQDIHGKVGTYANLAKAMHVFPILNFKISYKLF